MTGHRIDSALETAGECVRLKSEERPCANSGRPSNRNALVQESNMANRASSAPGVCPSIPNMTTDGRSGKDDLQPIGPLARAICAAATERRRLRMAGLSATIDRQKAALEARADEPAADFLHADLVRAEMRRARMEDGQ